MTGTARVSHRNRVRFLKMPLETETRNLAPLAKRLKSKAQPVFGSNLVRAVFAKSVYVLVQRTKCSPDRRGRRLVKGPSRKSSYNGFGS